MNYKIKLTKDNFVESVFKYNGYFCEHFPLCFNTNKLAKSWNLINKRVVLLAKNNGNFTYPISISISKSGYLRRNVYIPNIFSFISLLDYLENNFDFIIGKCRSRNSESKISYMVPFDYPSSYRSSIVIRNKRFIGYRYKLKLDISNCFNSIYTHSITWACTGKKEAKLIFSGKIKSNKAYDIGDKIDELNRRMNGNQTNGILTGPFTSRICSELILSYIDGLLEEEDFKFTRYVDDYNFYFLSEAEAQDSITKIANILNEFNFLINKDKISITKYPFDLLNDFKEEFILEKGNSNVYVLLQKALKYADDGNVGALKYFLKMLADKDLPIRNLDEIIGILLNSLISFPLLSPYIVRVIELYIEFSIPSGVVRQLNKLLEKEIALEHQHETLWLLYILLKSKQRIKEEIIKEIFKSGNDFAIIMILDYLNSEQGILHYGNLQRIYNLFRSDIDKISNILKKNTQMHSTHWLLHYTVAFYDLTLSKKIKIGTIKSTSGYKVFANNNISFYTRLCKEKSND